MSRGPRAASAATASDPAAVARTTLPLELELRLCREGDLERLEWFGQFTHHREIIHDAFARQQRGENLMLLAVVNGFPVGQVWANLARLRHERAALLWAVRVLQPFRGMGIAARLLTRMERLLAGRGIAAVEIGVEKANGAARRLYERLGYAVVRDGRETYAYTTPAGVTERIALDEWFLRKSLAVDDASGWRPGAEPS